MADIALVTSGQMRVVESRQQMTLPAAEAIAAGDAVRLDVSNGKFTKSNATTDAEARVYGVALKTVAAGEPVTAIRRGVLDGLDLSGLSHDAKVFLSNTDGRLADAVGTVSAVMGRVVPGTATTLGTAYDKLLEVEQDNGAGVGGEVVVNTELLAASVDKWIFVASRAYQVMLVEEIHSVVGGSGAVVRPRKITAAGTAAPGDAAGGTG